MANKPINYVLHRRTPHIGKYKDQLVHQAMPTGRERVDFRSFTERVAKATTFTPQEVAAVLNYATEIAKDIVANGDIVEFGDLGALTPTFVSKVVPVGEEFKANVHILKPAVRLRPNQRYFRLDGVSYERVEPKPKKPKAAPEAKPKDEEGSGSGNSGDSGGPDGTGGHLGI